MKSNFYKNITETSVAEPKPVGNEAFLAGAGADLKFELEPEPIFWVGSGSFFWQVKNEMISRYSLFIVW